MDVDMALNMEWRSVSEPRCSGCEANGEDVARVVDGPEVGGPLPWGVDEPNGIHLDGLLDWPFGGRDPGIPAFSSIEEESDDEWASPRSRRERTKKITRRAAASTAAPPMVPPTIAAVWFAAEYPPGWSSPHLVVIPAGMRIFQSTHLPLLCRR